MRIPIAVILGLTLACHLTASDALDNLSTAMVGDDFQAKREAIQAVVALPKDQDEKVLTALVGAVADRQASEAALAALRSRTGLAKPGGWVKRGSGYPNYPTTDDAAGWGAWLGAWKKEQEDKKKVDSKVADLEKKAKQLEKDLKDKDKKNGAGKDGDGETVGKDGDDKGKKTKVTEVNVERGPLCRVHFRNGGSKVYHLLLKRTDADGNLQSIRVSYTDGGGTETISADTVSRLEEDVK